MKDDERRKKKNKPEGYIDLFADDDEEEEASVGSLFSDDDEDEEAAEEEDLAAEDEETEEDGADGEEAEPVHTEYGMPLPTDEEASYVEPEEKFDRTGNASKESFAFDRFGRRMEGYRILALNRGEKLGILKVGFDHNTDKMIRFMAARFKKKNAYIDDVISKTIKKKINAEFYKITITSK